MNIFRLLGKRSSKAHYFAELTSAADFSHLASIFILLQKMKSSSVRFVYPSARSPLNWDRRVVPDCRSSRKCFIYLSSLLAISVSLKTSPFNCWPKCTNAWDVPVGRPFLDLYRLAVPHYLQAPLHWIVGLHYLSHAERLQAYP